MELESLLDVEPDYRCMHSLKALRYLKAEDSEINTFETGFSIIAMLCFCIHTLSL